MPAENRPSQHPIPQELREAFSRIEDEALKLDGAAVFTMMRSAAMHYFEQNQGELDLLDPRRLSLIAYWRSEGLSEASELCNRMAWEAYYPPGTRFKVFTPKAQKSLGDLLIKAANKIASLPGGPYERFKAHQQKQTHKHTEGQRHDA